MHPAPVPPDRPDPAASPEDARALALTLGRLLSAFGARPDVARMQTTWGAFGQCGVMARRFALAALDHGRPAEVVRLDGAPEGQAFPRAHPVYQAEARELWVHHVTRVGGLRVDWTARQFDPEAAFPLVALWDPGPARRRERWRHEQADGEPLAPVAHEDGTYAPEDPRWQAEDAVRAAARQAGWLRAWLEAHGPLQRQDPARYAAVRAAWQHAVAESAGPGPEGAFPASPRRPPRRA